MSPFKLEFDLLFASLPFVLDVELGTSGHVNPFSSHLDLESLTCLESVGQPAQLRYELGRRVDFLDVPVLLFAHPFSSQAKVPVIPLEDTSARLVAPAKKFVPLKRAQRAPRADVSEKTSPPGSE